MLRRGTWCALLLLIVASPAAAQDQALDPLLFDPALRAGDEGADVHGSTVQLYRLPLSKRLRAADGGNWGLRLTFPVTLSSLRVEGVSDIGPFVKRLGVGAIIPGIELEIPVGERWRLRPFVEAGIGRGTERGETEVLYGSGVRARSDRRLRQLWLSLGASGMYRKLGAADDKYGGHSTFEAAADAQLPLGFSIGGKASRGGIYGIARGYGGLRLERAGQPPIDLEHQFEVGVSFATDPILRLWKVSLPWVGVGYQFGEVLSGVRIYTKFPF